ncbi:BTB/POZ domain-containing protein 6-B-like [Ostrinia nubilalis]|uniref:BTB/POZ domain-containing protein 6-B-like n=1 Tax=Ostrinia nubilalis TaxID=29057 RepID=UPI0030823066
MAVPSTDWQLGCMQLKQRGAHLLQTGQWADCVFMVGAPPRQVTVTAHKLILASASPVFEAMFFGGMAERDGPIPILDVHPDAFKALLQYIYTDKAELGSFEMACSIYYGAKKYMLPYLEKECTWFISLNLRPKNVCRAYELGQLFDESLLMEKCLKVMENQTKEVVNAASFLDADLSTINKILSLESLNIESELDLFRALEKYAKVHMKGNFYKRPSLSFSDSIRSSPPKKIKMDNSDAEKTQNITNFVEQIDKPMGLPVKSETVKDVPNSETGEVSIKMSESYCEKQTSLDTYNDESMNSSQENLELSSLRSAIGKVRFLTMSPAAFAAGPARSPLLSEPQCFALLMHIVSTDSDVPMPEGFSTSRVARNQQNLMPEESSSKSEAVFRFTVLNFRNCLLFL